MTEEPERGRSRERSLNTAVTDDLWDEGTATPSTDVKQSGDVGLPVKIRGALTLEQMTAYQTMFRIKEITDTLNAEKLVISKHFLRSPSPPPTYDEEGKRTNTREQRYRKKLEEERYRLVEIAIKMIPFYVPPLGYVRPTKFQDKLYVPVDQYPDINFVGLLLGPRGNTLRKLQEESKCKIAIRGRGSVKEGKNASDLPKGAMNMDEPLHCLVISDSEEKIQNGIKACQGIIIKAITSPEGQNDLKRGQLRELAELNGTLREDNRPCTICGLQGHKKYDCPNRETLAFRITCNRCGQKGHATRDCPMRNTGNFNGDIPPPPPPPLPTASLASHQPSEGGSTKRPAHSRYEQQQNHYQNRYNADGGQGYVQRDLKRRHVESRYSGARNNATLGADYEYMQRNNGYRLGGDGKERHSTGYTYRNGNNQPQTFTGASNSAQRMSTPITSDRSGTNRTNISSKPHAPLAPPKLPPGMNSDNVLLPSYNSGQVGSPGLSPDALPPPPPPPSSLPSSSSSATSAPGLPPGMIGGDSENVRNYPPGMSGVPPGM